MNLIPTPSLSPADTAQVQQIIHQIQNHQFSGNQGYFASLSFFNPFPWSIKLAIYHFLNSLPIPELPEGTIIILFIFGPILSLILLYIVIKLAIKLSQFITPLILSKLSRPQKEKTFLELTFPHDTSKSSYATEQLYKLIHTVSRKNSGIFSPKKTISLEIVSTRNEGIRFIIGIQASDADVLHRSLLSYLPGLTVKQIPDYLSGIKLSKETKSSSSDNSDITEELTKPDLNRTTGVIEFKLSSDFVLPLQNQKVLDKHDSIAFITGNMTKLTKGELIAFQIITNPNLSSNVKHHMQEIKNLIYRGLPLSEKLAKQGGVPMLSIALFILSPIAWLIVGIFKLLINLPFLILDPKGPHAKAFFESKPNVQLQEILNPYEQELATVIKEKLADHLFETTIRILIVTEDPEEFDARQTGLVSSFSQFASAYQELLAKGIIHIPFLYTRLLSKRLKDFKERSLSSNNIILSSSELTDLYHFPNMDITKIEGLVKSKSSQLPSPRSMKRDEEDLDVIVGMNTYGGEQTPVGLRTKDRGQHTYIVGKTGMGKSTIIEGMAIKDIESEKGVAVIDPHGDMVEHLLKRIPKHRLKDVVYVNPYDKQFPIGLNILNPGISYEDVEEQHRRIATTVMSIFMKITPEKHWGQRMEHILRNAILTTLQIKPGSTHTPYISLYTIQKLLTDETYRKTVTATLKDPILKQFWEKEFMLFRKGQQGDIVAPLTNKIGEFITDPLSRHILLQENSTINISEIMDEGKILLVNLSKGNLGEERSAFFGTIITSLIQLATYARAQIPEHKRSDFFVYIDEFQNFATTHFTELFSESRKYHVFFIPSHQNIAQIDDPKVSKIIKGNSGIYIVLKGSSDDEKVMLPILEPEVTDGQIVNLPPHHFFMKITNGESEDAFSGVTVPITDAGDEQIAYQIIENSRKHSGTAREAVEKQLKKILQVTITKKKRKKKPAKPTEHIKPAKTNGLNNGVKSKGIREVKPMKEQYL